MLKTSRVDPSDLRVTIFFTGNGLEERRVIKYIHVVVIRDLIGRFP